MQFEFLTNLQKDQKSTQLENLPQLRLAPPAVYHEKVKKGPDLFLNGESSSETPKIEEPSSNKKRRELKLRGSSIRFPLKTSIFGKFSPFLRKLSLRWLFFMLVCTNTKKGIY